MIYKVKKTIDSHNLFKDGAHVVLGLSGGPDSMCLFDVLCELSKTMNITIHPVHINHKFRPGAAESDQNFVESICQQRGICCHSFVYNCNEIAANFGLTSEEAGRKARYQAFAFVAAEVTKEFAGSNGKEQPQVVIAVAQNSEDQCETILFRILRGTGVDGLSGISYKRKEKLASLIGQLPLDACDQGGSYKFNTSAADNLGEAEVEIIRPLLDVSRQEIEEYCTRHKLQPRRDHTNEQAIYARNRIRLELLPYLAEKYNENIRDTINRLGSSAAVDRDFLWHETEKAFEIAKAEADQEGKVAYNIESLKNLHKAIRFRLYNKALSLMGMKENITSSYLNQIESVLWSANPSSEVLFPGGYVVCRKYDRLVFEGTEEEAVEMEYSLKQLSLQEYMEYLKNKQSNSIKKAKASGIFGGTDLPELGQLELRKRREGDYIWVQGPKNKKASIPDEEIPLKRKKLQDFFVDEKVPKSDRDKICLLSRGSEVLWILPSEHFPKKNLMEKGRYSAKYKANFIDDKMLIVLEIF